MKIKSIGGSPRIVYLDILGTVRIVFPDGSRYEYETNDRFAVDQLRRRFGRNMGRFAKELARFTQESGGSSKRL